jgi:hypothetical protein
MKGEWCIGKHGYRDAPVQESEQNTWVKDVVCGCPPAGNAGLFSLQKKPPFTHILMKAPYGTSA